VQPRVCPRIDDDSNRPPELRYKRYDRIRAFITIRALPPRGTFINYRPSSHWPPRHSYCDHSCRGMTTGGLLILDAREWRTGSILRISMRSISDQTTEIEARRTARNDGAATTATTARVKLKQARSSANSINETRPVLLMRTKVDGPGV
jgi:hypothetical protein